jgi:pentatricopeptide repeat protein
MMVRAAVGLKLACTMQARAALPDAARETLVEAKACGLQPGVRLHNLVVIAYARTGRATEAEAFVREEMAASGITPDIVTW